MSSVPTYLMSRNGIWYFNYRVPSFLRNRYNIQKLFIRKSLRTTNVREAIKVSRKYTFLIVDNTMDNKKPITGRMKISGQFRANDQERKLRELEDDQEILNDALVIGRKIAEEYEDAFKKGKRHEQIDFWKQYSEYEYECYRYAVDKNNEEQARKKSKQKQKFEKAENQFVKKIGDEVQVTVVSNVTTKSAGPESSITLNDLIEEYINDKISSNDWKESIVKGNTQMLWVIRDFLECIVDEKNPMIHLFKPKHSKAFKQLFSKYPANRKQKFPDESISKIFTLIKSDKIVRIPLNPDTQSSRNRTVSPRESGHSVQ